MIRRRWRTLPAALAVGVVGGALSWLPTAGASAAGPIDAAEFSNAGRPSQAGPEQTGPDQAGPDQTGPDQTGPDQTGLDQTGPEQTGPEQTGPEQIDPEAGLDPDGERMDAIRAFQRAFPGVPDAVAWQRITAENERAALIAELAEAEPDRFGGAWYDGATDTQHLQATSRAAAERFARIAADRGINASVHLVRYSHDELVREMDQALNGTHPVLGSAARDHAGIDVRANRVVVTLTDAGLAAAQSSRKPLPGSILVRPRSAADRTVPDACPSRAECDPPLRSGLELWKGEPGRRACSLGFTASGRKYPHHKYVITAGHCGGMDDIFGHNQEEFGPVEEHRNSGDVDALAIRIENEFWLDSTFGWIFRPKDDNEPPFPVDGRIDTEDAMQAGQTVCLTARNSVSGKRCGVIDEVDSDHRGMTRVAGLDACSGDSGGGWYRKSDDDTRIAYGIHSDSSETCHDPDGVSFFSTLPAVQEAVGKDVDVQASAAYLRPVVP